MKTQNQNEASEIGEIYIATNAAMPGLVKIGFTTVDVEVRLAELSNSTAVPLPFEEYATLCVENPAKVEAQIHSRLFKVRVSPNREFFSIDPAKAFLMAGKVAYGVASEPKIYAKSLEVRVRHAISNPTLLGANSTGAAKQKVKAIVLGVARGIESKEQDAEAHKKWKKMRGFE